MIEAHENLKKQHVPSLLFELPQNLVVSFFVEWLNMVDICHLDSAVCSKRWRAGFLNILKHESIVFNGFIYSESFKKEYLTEHDPSEIFSKGLGDVRSSSTVEPYVTSFDHPEYSAFRTSDRQCGEQSLPKTLRTRNKLEQKERKKHQLERWQDKSQVRHSYNIPDSVFCLPHHEAGLMYIRWLTLRNISVQHLLVTIDFRSWRGKECFLNYLNDFQDYPPSSSSNNSCDMSRGKKRLRYSEYLEDEKFLFLESMEDFFPPRKSLAGIFSDEIETVECLGSVDIGTSTSDNISVTNAITPIQSHRDVSAARVIDLSTEDGEMDVTMEYNNGININATQSSASPDKLKGSKDATIFAEAVSISPRSPSIHGLTGKSRGYSACKRLRSMCFRRCAGLTDDVIIAIQPCKQLDTLELLDCTMITDDGFVTMSEGWTSLKSLNVRDSNRLSDTAIIAITERCPKLEFLDMHSCNRVTDKGLSSVAENCKGMRNLFLSFGFSVSDDGINDIIIACHDSLESLSLELCNKVTDEGMRIFSQITCSAMRQLNLWGCTRLSDDCLTSIVKGLPNLTSLSVGLCVRMTDEAVKIAVQGCPLLQHLNFNYCLKLTDEALETIALYCPALKSLGLSMCKCVTDLGVKLILKSCLELENLNLESCDRISDDFLPVDAVVAPPAVHPAAAKARSVVVIGSGESMEVAFMQEQEVEQGQEQEGGGGAAAAAGVVKRPRGKKSVRFCPCASIGAECLRCIRHLRGPDDETQSRSSSDSSQSAQNQPPEAMVLSSEPQDALLDLSEGLENDTSLISDGNSSTLKDSNDSSMMESSNENDISSLSIQTENCNVFSPDSLLYSPGSGYLQASVCVRGMQASCSSSEPTALLPKLLHVNVSECKRLTDTSLRLLAKHSPHLRILNVLQCPYLTREGLNILRQNCCDVQIIHAL